MREAGPLPRFFICAKTRVLRFMASIVYMEIV